MNTLPRTFAVVPAAGVGRRIGGKIPKQYLPLDGSPILVHTLNRLLIDSRIQLVVVAINPTDTWWPQLTIANHSKILVTTGGTERCHSVLNSLHQLQGIATPHDWILVHDAVRPCLRTADLDRLFQTLINNSIGGILGSPVRDTMKRTEDNNIVQTTVSRANLWHAYTPQMFRYNLLQQSLYQAMQHGQLVTDEAEAMELAGYSPLMVEGHPDNIKITRPEDLAIAEFFITTYPNV